MAMQTQRQPELILASSSPRRQELIRALGLPYSVQPSDADETVPPGWPPDRIVEQLALRKADAVARVRRSEGKDGIVVGSDTIVVLDGAVLGKPVNEADAERALTALQGRSHEVYTGVALVQVSDGRTAVSHRATVVHMKPCSTERIRRYIATGEPMDKAGAYDTTMHLGDIGQYRVLSQSPSGQPEVIVGHTVSKVTFRPMSDAEIEAYVKTGEPLDKAGSYGAQGLGAVFIEKIEGDFFSIMGLPLNLLYQMLLKFGISPFQEK
ncbi:hypothetical protein J27TS7_15730 [Paenibacillus dendritiformis]|nr:Maf family protein [Paenibacillus dendritiformis]GIO72059.1 hypothetical protein J27TS7_15730 [Paenibacillus dendritiformis]